MTIARGRVVPAADARGARALTNDASRPRGWGRRVAREVMEARAEAARVTADAEARALAVAADARRLAEADGARVVEAMAADAEARIAARYLALRAEDERRAERDRDRAVALALAVAERIVGRALELEPSLVVELTRRALAEARGARRVVVEACPEDADTLRAHLAGLGWPEGAVEVRECSTLGRGDLCLHTDLGTLHARLSTQLERLAEALHDVLRR